MALSIDEALLNHLALPVRLPQIQDRSIENLEAALADRIVFAAKQMRDLPDTPSSRAWESIRESLETGKSLAVSHQFTKFSLLAALRQLTGNDFLVLHLRNQNAAVFIYPSSDLDRFIFEVFESSPANKDVLAASTALQWQFPGSAISVPASVFRDASFLENFASFLEQAALESPKDFTAYAAKAGSLIPETRDTADPALITSMLVAMLEGLGTRIKTPILQKRIRDDVCWENAHQPWRRLAFWLVTRVTIQRYLSQKLGGECGRIEYKYFICLVLAKLLEDITRTASLERLNHLKTKLCRRLFKLEQEVLDASPEAHSHSERLSNLLSKQFDRAVVDATSQISYLWEQFKKTTAKSIPPIPRRAHASEFRLSLPISGGYLRDSLLRFKSGRLTSDTGNKAVRFSRQEKNNLGEFPKPFLELASMEATLQLFRVPESNLNPDGSCGLIASNIEKYLGKASSYYEDNFDQISIMILTVMELWVALDQVICRALPLLEDFRPPFHPSILDVLRLDRYRDMMRLQKLQNYLKGRYHRATSSLTIFHEPSKGCFAERYYTESAEFQDYETLRARIEADAEDKRLRKKVEWSLMSEEYEKLTRSITESACIFIEDSNYPGGKCHSPSCPRCQMQGRVNRMKIEIVEHPLPDDELKARVVIFELRCPRSFQIYRDVTWLIISRIASAKLDGSDRPRCILEEYQALSPYSNRASPSVTLGSTTKSFLATHFRWVRFPVSWEQLERPHGLKYGYFDRRNSTWPGRRPIRPAFIHHCRLSIPSSSPLASFNRAPTDKETTSYEIIASQVSCPTGVNVHEFLSFQSLLGGTARRWISVLTELASSNLNFSTEATACLISHVAHQCGPHDPDSPLRVTHGIFRDAAFCESLRDQLAKKLDSIESNWREVYLLDTVILLALRLHSLSRGEYGEAQALLCQARGISSRWMDMLQNEGRQAKDPESSRRCQFYTLWAAVLCKRTYATYLDDKSEHFDTDSLSLFVRCSISLRNSFADNAENLPPRLKAAVIRDFKMMHEMKDKIRQAVLSQPGSFLKALEGLWSGSELQSPEKIDISADPASHWVTATIPASDASEEQQIVRYNYLHGVLLIDGMQIGKLPSNHPSFVVLEELFGPQSFLTYPSRLRGMHYTLKLVPNGHRIHIAYLTDRIVIRAVKEGRILEYMPRHIFRSNDSFDLPGILIEDHCHWLDLRTGRLEIRPMPRAWDTTISNWSLDMNNMQCSRTKNQCVERLIDPHKPTFQKIAQIFAPIEPARFITVFEPFKPSSMNPTVNTSVIHVELRRLQLGFWVNRRHRLYCGQLQAVVDEDQNAGTWHGLSSKLIVRSIHESQRTILVPFGELETEIHNEHIRARIHTAGVLGKFTINEVLGRVDCASEPNLMYRKAQLHAYTSCVLPDELTGRTGTEEALHWLSSAACQPWSPLSSGSIDLLNSIARLTPTRVYYPEGSKLMKTETWNGHLTAAIQHEAFHSVILRIVQTSNTLLQFSMSTAKPSPLPNCGDQHLTQRALLRRGLTERRSCSNSLVALDAEDMVYVSRDRSTAITKKAHANVLETTALIRSRPAAMQIEENLSQSLSQALKIGGYSLVFDKQLLSERLGHDLRSEWGALVRYSREHYDDPFSLIFTFAPLAFRSNTDMKLIRTIIAFGIYRELREVPLPSYLEYVHFQPYQQPTLELLKASIDPCRVPPPADERSAISEFMGAKEMRKWREQQRRHEEKSKGDAELLANHLLDQWPCDEPETPIMEGVLIDVPAALEKIRPEWLRLHQNFQFSLHLIEVGDMLRKRQSTATFELPGDDPSTEFLPARVHKIHFPSLSGTLIRLTGPSLDEGSPASDEFYFTLQAMGDAQVPLELTQHRHDLTPLGPHAPTAATTENVDSEDVVSELKVIISRLQGSKSTVRCQYALELSESLDSFLKVNHKVHKSLQGSELPASRTDGLIAQLKCQHSAIVQALEAPQPDRSAGAIRWLKNGGFWPAITPVTLLEHLRSAEPQTFGTGMREAVLEYGISVTNLQRQLRLNKYASREDAGRYEEESENCGHTNWSPSLYPDWLLLEIESNLLIRPDQVDVALATITPASAANSVLQMNMGQGKTSCIIPMVALVLANGSNLARVVVPKALLLQTAQILQSRLGGLLNRELRHVPFSRKTSTVEPKIFAYHQIHRDMQKNSGIMVCLPEHHLSFMLSGQQRLLDNRIPEAIPMINIQSWLSKVSRDVLDESDFTLAVSTQLIYPSGAQISVDGHPHRWLVVEQLLRLVDLELDGLCASFPSSIEVVRRSRGGYPLLYFLRQDVEEELIRRLTSSICNGCSGIIQVESIEKGDRIAIKDFISAPKPRAESTNRVGRLCPDKIHIRKTVYLLRGLLVNRILMMCLKKRWNVQYGLHPGRDPIAVPFNAKGVPSEQSEWGHPDVAILFTCLAFYYDGLSQKQLRQALEHLLKSDDPSCEYDRWTEHAANLPDSLREWNAINIDDEAQLDEVWIYLRYNMVAIDYYLNNFVFPIHAKQFRVKLQSNGWDIPLFSRSTDDGTKKEDAKTRRSLTTGFSGTNDNRSMLPLSIEQQDLPGLSHTNAEVLTYLLQKRNRGYEVIADDWGKRLGEEAFLRLLQSMRIRVLIDAGASILEMDNRTLVQKWLRIDSAAPAALYFDNASKPWILGRNSREPIPLLASTFADNLHNCLVYLDEAHTRGTDLKFPSDLKGALTLGLGQTKDHTVQAAMRLRQLGTTQSVVFFAPPEVNQSILHLQNKTKSSDLDSGDVVSWLLTNSCDAIERLQPLYYSQGMDFCSRKNAAVLYSKYLKDISQREQYVAAIKQAEQQTLRQLYEPKLKSKGATILKSTDPRLAAFVKELVARRRTFQDTGSAVHGSALQEVEQEREIAFEVESVRQVKKPLLYEAHLFPGLHEDLATFARTGRLPANSYACVPFLKAVSRTGLGIKFGVVASKLESKLFVSAEFEKTVKFTVTATNDNFLRPVNWVLWSELSQTAIVVIPEEAEELIPILRGRTQGNTFLMTYAAPITRKMIHFNHLNYYSVPSLPKGWEAPGWLRVEVGLFAGRLYFHWSEYDAICTLLGIERYGTSIDEMSESLGDLQLDGTGEGAVDSTEQQDEGGEAKESGASVVSFTPRPLRFLQEWLAVRRRGQDFVPTPMGYITQGKPLAADHSFFQAAKEDSGFAVGRNPKITRPANDHGDDAAMEADDGDLGRAQTDDEETDGETDEEMNAMELLPN